MLFVFASEDYQVQHGATLLRWYNAVVAEKNFDAVVWDWTPRTTVDSPDRLARVNDIKRRIREVRPTAIQIFGAVAMPASGRAGPDGHPENIGVIWGPVPYAFPDVMDEDIQTLVTNGLAIQLNVPRDGRMDRSYYTSKRPQCPVAFVSFADIPGMTTQPADLPCFFGPPVPPLDEHIEFEKYMERNLDYRTGNLPIERKVVWCERPLQDRDYPAYKAEMNWLPLQDTVKQIPRQHFSAWFMFSGVMPADMWYTLDDCVPDSVLVQINYRSYAWEVQGLRQGIRRMLTFGPLVSLWGPNDWHFEEDDVIVARSIERSWARYTVTGVPVLSTVCGDLTLPYFKYPRRVSGLAIVN